MLRVRSFRCVSLGRLCTKKPIDLHRPHNVLNWCRPIDGLVPIDRQLRQNNTANRYRLDPKLEPDNTKVLCRAMVCRVVRVPHLQRMLSIVFPRSMVWQRRHRIDIGMEVLLICQVTDFVASIWNKEKIILNVYTKLLLCSGNCEGFFLCKELVLSKKNITNSWENKYYFLNKTYNLQHSFGNMLFKYIYTFLSE